MPAEESHHTTPADSVHSQTRTLIAKGCISCSPLYPGRPETALLKEQAGILSCRFNKCLDATHREAVRTVVAIQRINVRRVEVQVACIGSIRCRRPVVAVAANVVQSAGGTVAVARSERESNLLAEWPAGFFAEDSRADGNPRFPNYRPEPCLSRYLPGRWVTEFISMNSPWVSDPAGLCHPFLSLFFHGWNSAKVLTEMPLRLKDQSIG